MTGRSRTVLSYLATTLVIALFVLLLEKLSPSLNLTSIALALMLLLILVAVEGGRGPALFAAVFAGLAFNFFFIQPYHSFRIHQAEDMVAFAAFVVTAVIVGQLSSRLEKRVIQAETQRQQLEQVQGVVTAQAAEADALRRSEQLKTALLDAVTHDLRTPLTSIKAAVSTVRKPDLAEDARQELYEVMEQEADRLDRFIAGMMDLAKLEAGQISLESRRVSVDEVIEDALTRAEPLLTGHTLEISVQSGVPAMQVDPRLISQVLFTLIDNAAKNSPSGSRICVSARSQENAGIGFAVTDQGPGIPAALREKVFQKFFRAGSRSGYGVGLAVARGIIQAHRGKIWIEDGEGGHGTSVRFEVPMPVTP